MYADQKPHCGFRPAFFIAYNAIKIKLNQSVAELRINGKIQQLET